VSWLWAIVVAVVVVMWVAAMVDLVRRRHSMSGAKLAAWVVAILIFPVAGAIAYFLAHGAGGGEGAPRDPVRGPMP
jgi:Phospholipase_D-nuclease N-terminal